MITHQNENNMKKSLSLHLMALAMLLMLASACTKKAAEYTNAIPADATEVVAVNLKSLAAKAGINDKDNKESMAKLTDAMKSGMSAATFQQMEIIMKDPTKSGVDVTAPVYVFSAPAFDYTTVVAKVASEADLRSFLEVAQKELLSTPLSEGEGYSFASINKQTLLAFNATTLLTVNYKKAAQLEQVKAGIAQLLGQTEEKSINSSAAFKRLQKMDGDINLFVSPTSLPGIYAKQLNFGVTKEMNLDELRILGSLSFEKGKIEMRMENFTEDEKLKALTESQLKSTRPLENTYLKYLPKSTVALLSVGVNGEEFYNTLLENEELCKMLSLSQGTAIQKLFAALQSDFTLGLVNVTLNKAPSFMAYTGMKDGTPLKELYEQKDKLGLKRGEDIVKLNDDEYVYKSRGMNIFFGIRDKQMLYITNDELLYKDAGKAANPSAKETAYASGLKGKRSVFVINTEAVLELPVVKMITGYGGAEYNMYYALCDRVSYLEAAFEGDKATITLQLKEKNVNALKQAANFVKEFAGL